MTGARFALWFVLLGGCNLTPRATSPDASSNFDLTIGPSHPRLTSISPTSGPTTGGTVISIDGSGFVNGPGLTVTFDGQPASNVQYVSYFRLVATTPAARSGVLGTVEITVTNPGGLSASGKLFSYFAGTLDFTRADYTVGAVFLRPKVVVGNFKAMSGPPDIAVTLNAGVVGVLLNQGQGTFAPVLPYSTGGMFDVIAVGDFNADRYSDLVVPAGVLMNQGDGTFATPASIPTGAYWLAAGDFDGDTHDDLVLGGSSSALLLGQGDGTFAAPAVFTNQIGEIALGDFNGDAKLDVVLALGNVVRAFLGDGQGGFAAPLSSIAGQSEGPTAVGDLNRDGKLDLAIASRNDNAIVVLIGKGDGSFETAVPYQVGPGMGSGDATTGVALGDFNADGNLDLAASHYVNTGAAGILLGGGDGTFAPKVDFAAGTWSESIAAGDFNGDRLMDLALVNRGDSTVSVLLNSSH